MSGFFNEIISKIESIGFLKTIDMLSGIGTLIASLVALFTLRVILSQKKESIRPHIFFGKSSMAYCLPSEEGQILRTEWTDEEDGAANNPLCYKLINAGIGVAEDIVLIEEFDLKKAKFFIKNLDKEDEIRILEREDGFEIRTSFDSSFILQFRVFDKSLRELGYMLTHNQEREGAGYIYDSSYLAFLSCFDYLRNKYDRFLNLDGFPPLYLTVKYKDIAGSQYKRKYISKFMNVSEHSYLMTIENVKNHF